MLKMYIVVFIYCNRAKKRWNLQEKVRILLNHDCYENSKCRFEWNTHQWTQHLYQNRDRRFYVKKMGLWKCLNSMWSGNMRVGFSFALSWMSNIWIKFYRTQQCGTDIYRIQTINWMLIGGRRQSSWLLYSCLLLWVILCLGLCSWCRFIWCS